MGKTKERLPARVGHETRAEREMRLLRDAVRRSDQIYQEYLATLSPQDRERLPKG